MIKTNPEQDYSYWSMSTPDLLRQFNENQEPQQYQQTGLTAAEANLRLSKYGKNLLKSKRETNSISLLISQSESNNSYFYFHINIIIFHRPNKECFNHCIDCFCKWDIGF